MTEDLPALVSPPGIEERRRRTRSCRAVNEAADALKAQGADLVVLLVHEGAASTDCATMQTTGDSKFAGILNGINPTWTRSSVATRT